MRLSLENMQPFPRIARFTGNSAHWYASKSTDAYLYDMAVFRWELGLSHYRQSECTFQTEISFIREYGFMAQATTKQDTKPAGDWKGFINVDLTEQDKAVVSDKWQKAKYGELLSSLVDVGKLSISFNPTNNTYNCAIIFYHEPLKGFCVSSFAPSPLMAVFITWYKLDVYADSITPDTAQLNKPAFG